MRAGVITVTLVAISFAAGAASPCAFCPNGDITTPEKATNIPGYEFLDSCATIAYLLPMILNDDAPECAVLQSMSSYCGCPVPEDSCGLCPDGSTVADPLLEVTFLSEQFNGFVPTCGMVEAYTASVSENDKLCLSMRLLVGTHCGCAPVKNHCVFCNGEPFNEDYRDVEFDYIRSGQFGTKNLGIDATCETLYMTQYQMPEDHPYCNAVEHITFHCGCNGGVFEYLGAGTVSKQAALSWIPRVVGSISLVGSLMILYDVLKDKKKRCKSMYHHLVSTIAVFDMVTSIVWIIGTAAMYSKDPKTDLELGIYGTHGTKGTCTAQGFFYQLGYTSVFLNVSLTIYYYLVVALGFREQRMKRLRVWLFVPPLVLGLGMSFAVIPFVTNGFSTCQYTPDMTRSRHRWKVLTFGIVPVLVATVVILALLAMIYWKVRTQRRTAHKWTFRFGDVAASDSWLTTKERKQHQKQQGRAKKDHLEHEVFVQCLLYALSFGITWPLLTVAIVKAGDFDLPYAFWVIVLVVAPMQGMNNAVCYFRPFMKRIRKGSRNGHQGDEKQSGLDFVGSTRRLFSSNELRSHIFSSFIGRQGDSSKISINQQEEDAVVQLVNLEIEKPTSAPPPPANHEDDDDDREDCLGDPGAPVVAQGHKSLNFFQSESAPYQDPLRIHSAALARTNSYSMHMNNAVCYFRPFIKRARKGSRNGHQGDENQSGLDFVGSTRRLFSNELRSRIFSSFIGRQGDSSKIPINQQEEDAVVQLVNLLEVEKPT